MKVVILSACMIFVLGTTNAQSQNQQQQSDPMKNCINQNDPYNTGPAFYWHQEFRENKVKPACEFEKSTSPKEFQEKYKEPKEVKESKGFFESLFGI